VGASVHSAVPRSSPDGVLQGARSLLGGLDARPLVAEVDDLAGTMAGAT
jgi:hypothetical protein